MWKQDSADKLFSSIIGVAHPSLKFAWAQIAEGEDNDEEPLQSQVGQEEDRHLRGNSHYNS